MGWNLDWAVCWKRKGKEKKNRKWAHRAVHGDFSPKKVGEIGNLFIFETFSKLQNNLSSNQI
jgi:hypothetical protein